LLSYQKNISGIIFKQTRYWILKPQTLTHHPTHKHVPNTRGIGFGAVRFSARRTGRFSTLQRCSHLCNSEFISDSLRWALLE
ncbi:hypothetical protein, partial [Brevibacterium sp.]|uniref:hypothetical protein n=1 Tax=Brevibacterium sp. TaxID=1701 RepID=UPI002811FD56